MKELVLIEKVRLNLDEKTQQKKVVDDIQKAFVGLQKIQVEHPESTLPSKSGSGEDDVLDFPDDIHEAVGTLDDIFHPGVGKIVNIFGGNIVGDDIAQIEHALQIRIDDVPLNEIEIRNVYAASVNYVGIRPPQGPSL